LTRTNNAQPAILVHSISIYEYYKKNHGFEFDVTMGHSLGEFSSLYASKATNFEKILKLVQKRANLMMEDSLMTKDFQMTALLPCSQEKAIEIIQETKLKTDKTCNIANINTPQQIVLSGDKEAIEIAIKESKKKGVKRTINLDVGGAFHSEKMRVSNTKFKREIEEMEWSDLERPVFSTTLMKDINKKEEVVGMLENQICSTVNFSKSVQMLGERYDEISFYEMGPKETLVPFVNRILDQRIKCFYYGGVL
jgi:[acyl-carrier-protein] S-malonyltransferase